MFPPHSFRPALARLGNHRMGRSSDLATLVALSSADEASGGPLRRERPLTDPWGPVTGSYHGTSVVSGYWLLEPTTAPAVNATSGGYNACSRSRLDRASDGGDMVPIVNFSPGGRGTTPQPDGKSFTYAPDPQTDDRPERPREPKRYARDNSR
jgi:hypothetical protein